MASNFKSKLMRVVVVCTLGLLLLASACERKAQLDLPYEGDKIVVNTFIQADSPVYIRVTKSQPAAILDDTRFEELSYAALTLLENGEPFGPLQWQVINGRGYFVSAQPARPGKHYSLTAAAAGLTTVSGADSMPQQPDISDLFTQKTSNRVRFTLKDPPGSADYYRIRLYRADSVAGIVRALQKIEFRLDPAYSNNFADIIGDAFYRDVVLKDERIAGKAVQFVLQTSDPVDFDYLIAEVSGLTEGGFRYLQSLNNQVENSQDSTNFLGPPVEVYSNIQNGYGIVAGVYAKRVSCRIQ
jgi:hypothetical protein